MRVSVLPVMTVLTVVAGAVGLQLGETTIAQIDPLYFQGGAVPARDVTNDPRPMRRNAFAEASGWDQGYADRAVDCGADCPPSLTRGAANLSIPLYEYSDPTIEPRWEQAEAMSPEEALAIERSAESARVRRYLDYPVNEEQAAARTMAAARPTAAVIEVGGPDGL